MMVQRLTALEQFDTMYSDIQGLLLQADSVDVGQWQSQDVSGDPNRVTMEILHSTLQVPIRCMGRAMLQEAIKPNLPWAEDHFQERVGGQPLNPPPSEAWWPFAVQGNAEHKDGQQFSHTYPERFWPRFANEGHKKPNGRETYVPHNGIRYEYGDLRDVVRQLIDNPLTRQAYLPVWFPEDTGATLGQRVPCTIGYHFLFRRGMLDITYTIRSCDFIRHFRDDVYMAMRLCQWVQYQAGLPRVGDLIMHIGSLHAFAADRYQMEQDAARKKNEFAERLLRAF